MVSIEEVEMQDATASIPPSQERLLDAQEIEGSLSSITRPTAQMHLTALAKKLRKESEALKRMEDSNTNASPSQNQQPTLPTNITDTQMATEPTPSTATTVTVTPTKIPATSTATTTTTTTTTTTNTARYVTIDRFAFDAGGYNAPFVTLYVPLPGVGSLAKDNISCHFDTNSFDLIAHNFNGKSYRLFKDNLEKDIVPEKSKFIQKADKIIIKLAKVKSEYGSYDFWSQLTAKQSKTTNKKTKDDPTSSIMDLMKEMYDSGDDKMKQMIGETMLKQRNGQLGNDDAMNGVGGFGQDAF